jgi:predicted RNA-binding Zn-ribbon protein involved in translation (DUF1610 family)
VGLKKLGKRISGLTALKIAEILDYDDPDADISGEEIARGILNGEADFETWEIAAISAHFGVTAGELVKLDERFVKYGCPVEAARMDIARRLLKKGFAEGLVCDVCGFSAEEARGLGLTEDGNA